jgi:Kef-type K+ transport system membrane component KefB
MAEFDINKVKGNDRFIAGGAVLLLIISFFPWYGVSYDAGSLGHFGGGSVNMWNAYGWNKFAFVLALAAGAIVIARLAGLLDDVQLPAGINLITLAISALASVILLLRFVTAFKSAGGFHAHPSFGWYVAIIVSFAMTYFAFLNFKSSGEQLPSKPSSPPHTAS